LIGCIHRSSEQKAESRKQKAENRKPDNKRNAMVKCGIAYGLIVISTLLLTTRAE
jgi:hypothetical protein